MHVTGRAPSTASVAVGGAYVTVAPAVLVAYATIVAGVYREHVGPVASTGSTIANGDSDEVEPQMTFVTVNSLAGVVVMFTNPAPAS